MCLLKCYIRKRERERERERSICLPLTTKVLTNSVVLAVTHCSIAWWIHEFLLNLTSISASSIIKRCEAANMQSFLRRKWKSLTSIKDIRTKGCNGDFPKLINVSPRKQQVLKCYQKNGMVASHCDMQFPHMVLIARYNYFILFK
jgi:hypothetical protein